MKKTRQALVLDFDNTITTRHLWKALRGHPSPALEKEDVSKWDTSSKYILQHMSSTRNDMPQISPTILRQARHFAYWIFGGLARARMLHHKLIRLARSGVDLFISSHGEINEIINCLKAVCIPPKLFRLIHAGKTIYHPETRSYRNYSTDKSKFIEEYLMDHLKYEKVVYVDDNEGYMPSLMHLRNIKMYALDYERGGLCRHHVDRISKNFVKPV